LVSSSFNSQDRFVTPLYALSKKAKFNYWSSYSVNCSLLKIKYTLKYPILKILYKFLLLKINYYQTSQVFYKFFIVPNLNPVIYLLSLNFKRLRFFPGFKTTKGVDFSHLSLGLLNSYFSKGKFFLKSKIVYLALASFFRKILIFSGIKSFFLHINRNPKYFLEILNTLLEPVINMYSNPFNTGKIINEQQWNPSFLFHSVIFTNPKPYGKVKVKQKGRLKRKINSRIITINRVLD
jgi:hypothetical protein